MSAQHTPGRLFVLPKHPDTFHAETPGGRGLRVGEASSCRTKAEDYSNARRLVACWNACEGISTYELERHADDAAPVFALLTETWAQRDALLAALKSLMEMLDDEIKTSTDEQLAFGLSDPACPEHIKSELNCVIACRAAIAKAGGEA